MSLALRQDSPPRAPWVAWQAAWNLAGGVRYHLGAWRYHRSLWAPYRLEVARFLQAWQPPCRELAIIGPSAGWHLPAEFLRRFSVVYAIDPDPLAHWLLRRRFAQVRWVAVTDDYFTPAGARLWSDNTARLFSDFPQAALFFAHFLGQLPGLYPQAVAVEQGDDLGESRAFQRWKALLNEQLSQRHWASMHDRLSSPTPPALGPTDLAAELPRHALQRLAWPQGAAVADHLTGGLAPAQPRRLLAWQRTPRMWHLVEALYAGPTG